MRTLEKQAIESELRFIEDNLTIPARLTIEITNAPDGYTAVVKELPGCLTVGDSLGEVLKNLHEAIILWLATKEERSED